MIMPTRATAAGCVVAFFGFLAWAYAGLCFFAVHLEHRLPVSKQDPRVIWTFGIHGVAAFLGGLALVWVGFWWAMRADMSNPHDPAKPRVRF
jgi:hypothetical protein